MKLEMEIKNQQLALIIDALEEYFRIRMGQAHIVADQFAMDTFPNRETFKDPHEFDKAFDRWIEKREHIQSVLQSAIDINYGSHIPSASSDICRNVSDIWCCIRHEQYVTEHSNDGLWDIRSAEPYQLGELPMPKVKIVRDENEI